MCRQRDFHLVVNVEPFRVVIGALRQQGDACHEAERLDEIGELEIALQILAVQPPVRKIILKALARLGSQLLDHLSSFPYLPGMAHYAPTLAQIEQLAQAAAERLPDLFRQHLGHVILKVEDFPDEDVMRAMGLETPFDILGLYWGHHVGDPGAGQTGALPPTIFLYRRPLLDEWAEGEDSLEHLVAHVLIHEIGHHFGLSDDDIDAIEESVD